MALYREASGRSLLVLTAAVTLLLSGVSGQSCQKTGPCSCQNDQGTLDLTPVSNSDGTPRFTAVGSDSYTYNWNPCTDFAGSDGPTGGCTSVAACQVDVYTNGYPLGSQNTAAFSTADDGKLQLVYTATDTAGTKRTGHVKLVCDQNKEGDFTASGEDTSNPTNYYMTLTSKYACFSGAPLGGGGLSGGTILIIIVLVLVVVYLIAGVAYNYKAKGKSGVELLPNVEFWKSVPYSIRDGFRFVMSGCRVEKMYQTMS